MAASALVNEAYLKLIDVQRVQWQNRAHFFAVAARLMRRILVDFARRKHYQKRGGDIRQVTLNDELIGSKAKAEDLVAIDDALKALEAIDPRKVRIVEMRFFGGSSVEEIAEALGISTDTVTRDWKFARAWLRRELNRWHRSKPPSAIVVTGSHYDV